MRTLGWIVAGVLGLGALGAVAFFLYLNWAFTPRRVASTASATTRVTGQGTLGGGLHFTICEFRESGRDDVWHEVWLSTSATAPPREGELLLRAETAPVPNAVRRVEGGQVEIGFAGGVAPVRVTVNAEGRMAGGGFVYFENKLENKPGQGAR